MRHTLTFGPAAANLLFCMTVCTGHFAKHADTMGLEPGEVEEGELPSSAPEEKVSTLSIIASTGKPQVMLSNLRKRGERSPPSSGFTC